jgi:hypothetical protein
MMMLLHLRMDGDQEIRELAARIAAVFPPRRITPVLIRNTIWSRLRPLV